MRNSIEKIFNEKLFGDDNLISKCLRRDFPDQVYWDGDTTIENLTIFDYLLAWKWGVAPDTDDDDIVYFDWTGARAMSRQAHNRLFKNMRRCGTIDVLVDSVQVHQDLFCTATLNVAYFYPALTVPSEPYKVLCMQWDGYTEIYIVYHKRIENLEKISGANTHTNDRSSSDHESYTYAAYDSSTTIDPFDSPFITCIQGNRPIIVDVDGSQSFKESMLYAYNLFTSYIGTIDCMLCENIDPGHNYRCARVVITSDSHSSLISAIYPNLFTTETFFSTVYG